MLFFQVLLLLGYLYAHAATKWLGAKKQSVLHIGLFLVAALLTRLTLPQSNSIENNQWQVLLALALMVGAPFFVLSAGAPLIQRWFAQTNDPAAKDPYFLYSASNVGSMVALLAYPFLIEPRFALATQGKIWTYGFLGLIALMAVCAFLLMKQPSQTTEATAEVPTPITSKQRLSWVLLAAVPSSLLLGVTNYMTTNIAPMPLLWIVPLTIYLITFIVAFARRQFVKASTWARIFPLLFTPLVLVMVMEATTPMMPLAGLNLATFAIAALMCHTRLVETRPSAGNLTEFYVWLSVGGAVGGLFNALFAPTVFNTLAEYPIALVAACLLRPRKEGQTLNLKLDVVFGVAMFLIAVGIAFAAREAGMPPSQARTALVIGLPAILCFLMVDHPIRYGLMIGAMFLSANVMKTSSAGSVIYTGRSFFGIHRVVATSDGRFHELVHGNTTHGLQDMKNPGEPLTYYTRTGPIGTVFEAYPKMQDVALVGLGVGSCAAYGFPGQRMTYFEIDPLVEKIAKDPKYFTFLQDTKADLDVVLGDARLTLARQAQKYDLVALDAFSSDSIPIHLMTREAVEMYVSKLKPNGFLAFHISNRYLQLEPILTKVAQSLGLTAYSMVDAPSDEEMAAGKRPSNWMVLTKDKANVEKLVNRSLWQESEIDPKAPLWTDDYSNILSAFDPD